MTLKIHGTDNIQPGSIQAASLASGVGGGPKITNVVVTNSSYNVLDDTAVGLSGGYIKITGTGFASGCQVVVGATVATAVVFVSSTEVRAQIPAQSAGSYTLYVTNSDGGVAIRVNAVNYSSTPTWTTTSPLSSVRQNTSISIQLTATSNSSVTYALQAGSSLPSGLTLSSNGLITGTTPTVQNETTYNFTVVATDLENQDTPQAFQVTITINDLYFKYVTLLLNNQTNNVLTDSSTNNFSLIAYGDARASNFTPYGTGWSAYFNGSGNYLYTPNTGQFAPAGDFTIGLWVYPTSVTTQQKFFGNYTGINSTDWSIAQDSNLTYFYTNGNIARITSPAGSLLANTWNYIALVRVGSTLTAYINGSSVGTYTQSGTFGSPTKSIYIGADGALNGYLTNGYISNVLLVDGTAYTTVPTAPSTAVVGTKLLTLQDNRFVDRGPDNNTFTRNGDVRVSAFNPFNITNTGVNGSMYSVGATTSYVRAPASSAFLFTADFSVEMYIYTKATTGPIWGTGGSGAPDQIYLNGTGGIYYDSTAFTYFDSKSSVLTNSWNHICITRQSNTLRIFINGILIGTKNQSATLGSNSIAPGIFSRGSNDDAPNNELYLSNLRVCNGSVPVEYQTSSTTLGTPVFNPPASTLTAVANTQLLTLQYKQPHNNHGFQDSSSNQFLITRNGNTTQGTFSPFSQTGWGNYFNGSSDYLSLSDNTAFNFGTGDATVEFWFNSPGTSSNYPGIISSVNYNTAGSASIRFDNTGYKGKAFMYLNGGGDPVISSTSTLSYNTWYHVAITRSGTSLKMYINGTLDTTVTISASLGWYLSYGGMRIGRGFDVDGAGGYFPGYISNIRLVKGVAVYTGNFTPPTTPLAATQSAGTNIAAITGTQTSLLTCQSNRFVDNSVANSGTGFTITPNGSPSVQAFSPFNPSASWSAATYGGSGYFDGSGDYLGFPVSSAFTLGTNDFTIEGWLYPNTLVSGVSTAFVLDSNAYPRVMWYYVGGVFTVHVSTTGAGWDITQTCSVLVNQWNHLVLQRNGNDFRTFLNGSLAATTTASLNIPAQRSVGYVGRGDGGSQIWNGYVSGLRVVNGTAVYNTSGFTPPTSPPTAITNTSLLLNFTDAAIYDASGKNVFETVADAKISTTQSKWGGSIAFDGTGDGLIAPKNVLYEIGSGDWTWETWAYSSSYSATQIFTSYEGTSGSGYALFSYAVYCSGGKVGIDITNGSTSVLNVTSVNNVPTNSWVHLAITRSNGTFRVFINGSLDNTSSVYSGTPYVPSTAVLSVGFGPTRLPFTGYLQDVRITKGYARYTANFTPPTQPHQLQ